MDTSERTRPDSRGTIGGILLLFGVVIAIAGIADSGDEFPAAIGALIGGFLVLLGVILVASVRR